MKIGLCILILAMAGLGAIPKPSPSNLSLQQQRWNAATVRVEKQSETRWIARKIERNQARYETISKSANVPWQIVASIHSMECGLNFGQHLHNGDPLTARTRQVPAGRPKTGRPPFSFEESAKDALEYDGLNRVPWRDLTRALDALEAFNGTGYRKRGIATPYLWSGTNLERPGKFVADGKWSATAVSSQVGIVPILKELRVSFQN